jgi:hypothetical protein
MPLTSFWMHKTGKREGKPFSQCIRCERLSRGRGSDSGLVSIDRVWFIFKELQYRIGKAETCRRLGLSFNFWYRMERRIYNNIHRSTVKNAMFLLRELREENVARHRASIRHGSAQRGLKEREPKDRKDFNGKDEYANEWRRKRRKDDLAAA